jgi:hypothetical protein
MAITVSQPYLEHVGDRSDHLLGFSSALSYLDRTEVAFHTCWHYHTGFGCWR